MHFYQSGIVTGQNEVLAKVIFLHLSVILFTGGGGCLLQIFRRGGSAPNFQRGCLLQNFGGGLGSGPGGVWSGGCLVWGVSGLGGVWSRGVSGLRGVWSWGVCLRGPKGGVCLGGVWPSVMAFWFGGLLVWWPSGLVPSLVESGLLVWWPSGLVAFWLKVVFWFGGLLAESGVLVWWSSALVAFWLKVTFWFGAFWFGMV